MMKKLFGLILAVSTALGASQASARYLQADPYGLVDGPSVYGYAAQNPQRYTDPTGEFIPILVGIAIGFAIDAGVSYIEENCDCADPDVPAIPYVYPALGGAYGATGPFATSNQKGKGGPSGNRTSVLSQFVHNHGGRTGPLGPLRTFGRGASKFIPYAGAGTALYDGYRLRGCISQYLR